MTNKWDIGQEVNKEDYTEVATKCNELGDRHIERQGGKFIVVANEAHEPTIEEQVIALEQQYQMCRWQREMILAEGSSASDYAKEKAQEIEDLAEQIRQKNGGNL